MVSAAERVKARAMDIGFTKVGIARAEDLDVEGARLREWLSRGYHASMGWMKSNADRRVDPRAVLAGARSVVAVALNYYTGVRHRKHDAIGKVSRYAWGDDYHEIVGEKLGALATWMEAEFPGEKTRTYVDTGPVMDKAWAARAGIGWEGKHTNVITTEVGSWVFLGEVITTLNLPPDEPAVDRCGTCTLCLEACPTHAILAPYLLDSNRCISYLTIEHRGDFSDSTPGPFENWVYGCDICQDVCPWNIRFSRETPEQRFAFRGDNAAPQLDEWERMSEEDFARRFKGSPVKRAKHAGLVRNVRHVLREHGKRGR